MRGQVSERKRSGSHSHSAVAFSLMPSHSLVHGPTNSWPPGEVVPSTLPDRSRGTTATNLSQSAETGTLRWYARHYHGKQRRACGRVLAAAPLEGLGAGLGIAEPLRRDDGGTEECADDATRGRYGTPGEGAPPGEMSGAVFEDEKVRGRMDGRSLFTIYSLALAPPLGLRHGERPP